MPAVRRWRVAALTLFCTIGGLYYLTRQPKGWNGYGTYIPALPKVIIPDGHVHWKKLPERYPVSSLVSLPTGRPKAIPPVQVKQPAEDAKAKEVRLQRRDAVKESFMHSWTGYKEHAWLRDEVSPMSGDYKDTFGGWAATLVDALDTLWIMGLKEDFEIAVAAVQQIDFTTTESKDVNVFETTIRYMGGFLAAYDISEGQYPLLLSKAVEVGELLMSSFDTPNRMPITRWDWKKYTEGAAQKAPQRMLVSELGSLSLEFTRLSQLTGDPKYYDAVQRIGDEFEKSQNTTQLPGMWPVSIDASTPSFNEDTMFTLGGMSDSLYEYFPKQYLLLGGLLAQPKILYENFIEVAKAHMFFRVYNPKNENISLSGDIRTKEKEPELLARSQHLTCFTGGMVGLASKIFNRPADLAIAEELTQGCIWAYDSSPNGIMPEIFQALPCKKNSNCTWEDKIWEDAILSNYPSASTTTDEEKKIHAQKVISERRLPKGFTTIDDRRYILRPEAIESVFLMYRMTGKQIYAETAWRMFQAIEKVSRTPIAAAAIMDITRPAGGSGKDDENEVGIEGQKMDSMESFWLAETLKYFYLCFEEWDVVSLDTFVLNTEAHPLRRPRA
ncbi:glycoside hydrolase family 47 protein [Acephala macrosclerotiorum]|nr:glycoside hydrolase family 47 protein [Acephala macrosclerotiorum]